MLHSTSSGQKLHRIPFKLSYSTVYNYVPTAVVCNLMVTLDDFEIYLIYSKVHQILLILLSFSL